MNSVRVARRSLAPDTGGPVAAPVLVGSAPQADETCAACFTAAIGDETCALDYANNCGGYADYFCCVVGDSCSDNVLLLSYLSECDSLQVAVFFLCFGFLVFWAPLFDFIKGFRVYPVLVFVPDVV